MPITCWPTLACCTRGPTDAIRSRELHARDLEVGRRSRIEPHPLQQVGPVERGRDDVDEHLLRSGDRVGDVLDAEDVDVTMITEHDRTHGAPP